MRKISETGTTRNQNLGNGQLAMLHEGYVYMNYMSGTLDGTVITLTHGMKLAPCPSGFRVWEDLSPVEAVSGTSSLHQCYVTGGVRQTVLGWYAGGYATDETGVGRPKRVKIMPNKANALIP